MAYISFRDCNHIFEGLAGDRYGEMGAQAGVELTLDGRADVDQPITIRLSIGPQN